MQNKGAREDYFTYHCLIRLYVDRKNVTGAMQALNEMKQKGLRPFAATYTVLLSALSHQHDYGLESEVAGNPSTMSSETTPRMRMLYNLFEEMRQTGIPLLPSTYAQVVWASSRAHNLPKAFQYFNDMLSRGISPTTESICSLVYVSGFMANLGKVQEAISFFDKYNVEPNEHALREVLLAYTRCGRPDFVDGVLEDFAKRGVVPTPRVFKVLFASCATQQDFRLARHYCRLLEKYQVPIDAEVMKHLRTLAEQEYNWLLRKQESGRLFAPVVGSERVVVGQSRRRNSASVHN